MATDEPPPRRLLVGAAILIPAAFVLIGVGVALHGRLTSTTSPAALTTTTTASPPPAALIPRPSAALLAYDSLHKELVLFGCCDAAAYGERAITWTWDGITWSSHHEVTPPPFVIGSGAISEGPPKGPVVLFDSNTESDTWTRSGASWTLVSGVPSPPPENPGRFTHPWQG